MTLEKFPAKYASVEKILEVKTSRIELLEEDAGANFRKFARLSNEELKPDEDGYLYVRAIAISSRVNKNNDGWPAEELARSYGTFVGRPIFVDHNNDDPKRARGVIVDSRLHVDEEEKTSKLDSYYANAPKEHLPPTRVEILMEVDAKTFPKLAERVRKGDIDSVSMGANIESSICSVCANTATAPSEYCKHIEQKGLEFEIQSDNGDTIRKKAYEDCYGVNFFEISFVFDPADETALISEHSDKHISKASSIQKEAPGKKHVKEWSPKRNRQYEHILETCKKEHPDYSLERCKELAARTVNKTRSEKGETKSHKIAEVDLDQFIKPFSEGEESKNSVPQSELITAPQDVDTLRQDPECPICKADVMHRDPDGVMRCPTCGHEGEPEPLDNPDLERAKEIDTTQQEEQEVEEEQATPVEEIEAVEPIETIKNKNTAGVISDMFSVKAMTNSQKVADRFVPKKAAVVDTTVEFRGGIHFGTYATLKNAGLSATITYPDGETTTPPEGNPMKEFMLSMKAQKELGLSNPGEVPIRVEAPDDQIDQVLQIIHAGGGGPAGGPGMGGPAGPGMPRQPGAKVEKKADRRRIKREERELEDGVERIEEIIEETGEDLSDETEAEVVDETPEEPTAEREESEEKEETVEEDDRELAYASVREETERQVLARLSLAELAVEMGVLPSERKLAFVGELEDESEDQIAARYATLEMVKAAGLSKRQAAVGGGLTRMPRLGRVRVEENDNEETPTEAIFL